MRTVILAVYVIMNIPGHLLSQNFVNQSNLWVTTDGYYNFDQGKIIEETFDYWFENPIIIDSVQYLELKTNNPTPIFPVAKYFREKDGVVYARSDSTQSEEAIYNFNLDIGDQLKYNAFGGFDITVIAIDSVTLRSGSLAKRIEVSLDLFGGTTYWYEGIGSATSPFNPAYMFALDIYVTLDCYILNNSVELELGQCATNLSVGIDPEKEFALFPNPVADAIHLTGIRGMIQKFEIYDFSGNLVITSNTQIVDSIDVHELAAGIYILRIQHLDDNTNVLKFVKE